MRYDKGGAWAPAIETKHAPPNGRVIVVDENEDSQTVTCGTLAAAGYHAVGIRTTLALRRLFTSTHPHVVLCEASPPRTGEEVADTVQAVRGVIGATADPCRILLTGVQPAAALESMTRASGGDGFVERAADPFVLLRGILRQLPARTTEIPSRSASGLGMVKVLLIDDSELTLALMQAHLREAGFDVRIAVALGEARTLFESWSPNVIVADVNMPEIRGDHLCARLKAEAKSDAVIVLCSSVGEPELGALAFAAGADGFVSKSSGPDVFVGRVAALCRKLAEPIVSVQ